MPVFTGLEDLFTTPRPALKSLEHDWGAFDRRLAAEQQKRDADLLGITYRALMHYQAGARAIPAPTARLVRLLDWLRETGQLDTARPHLTDD